MAVRVRRGHAVGSNSWTRAMALSALALLAIPTFSGVTVHAGSPDVTTSVVGTPIAAPVSTGTSCTDETVRWGGFQVLDAAIPSFDTGVDVVPRAGTTLTVVGVSADGLDPTDHAHVMPVFVGGVHAVADATIHGGDVVVSTDGTEVLRSFGVTVVVRRCAEVAVAGPAPAVDTIATATTEAATPEAATTQAATTEAATPEAATAGWPTEQDAAAVVSTLPVTGRDSWPNTIIGGLLVAIGAALVTFGRRPRPDAR